jgi:four helix bundle protein
MATVERFEDLRVWQEVRAIVSTVYRLTAQFPSEERYGLSSQLRRAAVSTMSNIAEGFERGTNNEFIHFLYIAKGSIGEVRSQLYVALDLGYVEKDECDDLQQCCQVLSRRIHSFIEYLKSTPAKSYKLRESGPIWRISEPET